MPAATDSTGTDSLNELDVVGRAMTEVPFRKGELLLSEGDWPESFMVVVEGKAGVERVAEVGPGDLLGEVGLVLNEDRNATVRANSFSQLMDEVPGWPGPCSTP